MAGFDYRCRTCDARFEVRRPVGAPSDSPVPCPQGHPDTARLWSAIAVTGRVGSAPRAGGCCGGGCGCG